MFKPKRLCFIAAFHFPACLKNGFLQFDTSTRLILRMELDPALRFFMSNFALSFRSFQIFTFCPTLLLLTVRYIPLQMAVEEWTIPCNNISCCERCLAWMFLLFPFFLRTIEFLDLGNIWQACIVHLWSFIL